MVYQLYKIASVATLVTFTFSYQAISAESVFTDTFSFASTGEGLCNAKTKPILSSDTFAADGKTHLEADSVVVEESDISTFTGNVVIQQAERRVESDQAEYHKQKEEVWANGNVNFITPEVQIKSDTAHINLETNTSQLSNTEFQSLTSQGRGEAKSIEIKDSSMTHLNKATYTTCDPGNADWLLKSNDITLNHETRQGSATHATLRFKGVPFFYFPYLRFPLGSERLSGFLFPYIGSSKINGTELKIPYYWNIHPQVDATITPWYMRKRGLLLHSEFRYLTENNSGSFFLESLDNDKIFKDDRQRWHWDNASTPSLGWQTQLEYNYVADNQHLIDFSNDLTSSSTTYLPRQGSVSYDTLNWVLNLKAEDHQILSGANPYKRLPQITLNSRHVVENKQLNYAFQSEAVRFGHEEDKVIGDRVYLQPSVSYPVTTAAGFITPKLSLNHTQYNLEQTSADSSIARTVPSFSLNSGLFFERDSGLFGKDYLHTLEPQLFYVYTPYVDQSTIPNFDSSVNGFSINNFFSDYRFNSIDRIGDDNRLTTALATRFINQEDGQELLMARIGQIHYFTDRKVQFDANSDTSSRSNIITEANFKPGNWELSSQIEWDSNFDNQINSTNLLNYSRNNFSANMTQRFTLNSLETRETNINWALNSRWQFNLSNLHDVRNKHVIENLFGINYESCCWGLRVSAKERYINAGQFDQGVYIELILKGLGGFGTSGSSLMSTFDSVQNL